MAIAGQLVFSSVATPAPVPVDQLADSLRRACLSEAGVTIFVSSWLNRNQPGDAALRRQTRDAVEVEIGLAAWTSPFDIERFALAKRAADEEQAQRQAQRTEDSIAILRSLSP